MSAAAAVRQQLIGGSGDQVGSLLPIRADGDGAEHGGGMCGQGAAGMMQQGGQAVGDRFTDRVQAGLSAAQQLLVELGAGIQLQLGGGMVWGEDREHERVAALVEAEERIAGMVNEVVMQRKEMMSRIEGRVEGHACGVVLGHVGGLHLGAGGPLNSHLTRSGTSGEATVSENR